MLVDLNTDEIETILVSLQYSKVRANEPGTPATVQQAILDRINVAIEKLREARGDSS